MKPLTSVLVLLLLAPAGRQTSAQATWPGKEWPSAPAVALGLDENVLSAVDAGIASGKYGHVDSMLVIRHGKIAYDRAYTHDYDRIYGKAAQTRSPLNPLDPSGQYNYFNPWWHPFYRRGDLHSMQSVTKTVTSIVIGAAAARGEFPPLDTPVLRYFDESAVANVEDRKRRLTLRHLLTMTAGFDWTEDVPYSDPRNDCVVMEASFDWIKFAIDKPMAAEPGAVFKYNSGATQLLSHVFRRATGVDIEEYAVRHLFRPLGIERFYWKRTPTGLPDTEGGLYLRAHDLARLAYLFLRNGVWNGKAIVSPEWVKASTEPSVTVPGGNTKYGFKWWLHPYGSNGRLAWGGSGFGGQRPLVVPEHDLVIVFTGWNILPGQPGLPLKVALDGVVAAIVK